MIKRASLFGNFRFNKGRKLPSVLIALILFISPLFITGCGKSEKTSVRILCAGSLMVPLTELEEAFEKLYPDVDILTEGHGSIQVIRHVTELYEEADVMIVADHSLIPMLMYNNKIPETDEDYADWYIEFATNTLGIAYTSTSLYRDEIDINNWYEILARPDIKLGISDARFDACGYRTLMQLSLAESYYNDNSIFQRVIGTFNPSLEVTSSSEITTITVPEILRPESDRIALRDSSIRLLALLETGSIDYAFEYQSVAEQHGLSFLSLPPEINLGFSEYSELYQQVECKLDFQRFSSIQPVFTGEPIIYGITIPQNAPHPEIAQDYINFLLGSDGRTIFEESKHPMTTPSIDNPSNLPDALKALITSDNL